MIAHLKRQRKSVNAKEGINGLTVILGELSALRKTLQWLILLLLLFCSKEMGFLLMRGQTLMWRYRMHSLCSQELLEVAKIWVGGTYCTEWLAVLSYMTMWFNMWQQQGLMLILSSVDWVTSWWKSSSSWRQLASLKFKAQTENSCGVVFIVSKLSWSVFLFILQVCKADEKFNQLVHFLRNHKQEKHLVFFR